MKPEPTCARIAPELSAYLDGELGGRARAEVELHLETCTSCSAELARLERVRGAVRLQVVDEVPDNTAAIMERVSELHDSRARRSWVWPRLRVAAIAAAATAIFLIGTSLPFVDEPPETASASEIAKQVRAAARRIAGFEATYSIIERGWDARVPVRRFSASLAFDAPDSIRLRVADLTTYPDPSWPTNDFDLIANERRWSLRETSACPAAALPTCSDRPGVAPPSRTARTVINRQPFDGSTPVFTDLIVPVDTVTGATSLGVAPLTRVAGHDAYRLTLEERQAVALLRSLQAGGSWRTFHPFDRVDMWIDAETWVPLRFIVRAGASPDRAAWAERNGYSERPGDLLLQVEADDFNVRDSFPSSAFAVPERGDVRDAGFESRDGALSLIREAPAGLQPYLYGVGADGRTITSYSDGMTWLKVVTSRSRPLYPTAAEPIAVGSGFGLYQPADETAARRIDLFSGRDHLHVESNLPRAALTRVAASFTFVGDEIPARSRVAGGSVIRRVDPARAYDTAPFAERPSVLPAGYEPVSALLTRSPDGTRRLTVYYRGPEVEYDGIGVRITQSAGSELLPPSSNEYVIVEVDGHSARWSADRGELEWLDGGVYRSVAAPSFELGVALRIAEGLR